MRSHDTLGKRRIAIMRNGKDDGLAVSTVYRHQVTGKLIARYHKQYHTLGYRKEPGFFIDMSGKV